MSSPTTTGAALYELDEAERYARYDRLQERMAAVWSAMRLNEEGESVVVIPSVTVDRVGERSGSLTQAYEERFLFLLLLLRQPRLRMIYVTSMPIATSIIEYYLALLPGVIPSHARGQAVAGLSQRLVAPVTEREVAGAATATPSDQRADPGQVPLAPHPLQHHPPRA
jgi:hypothetical protein